MLKPVKIFKTLQHVSISYEIILREFVISLLKLLSFNLLSCHGFTVVMRQHTYGISALCALLHRAHNADIPYVCCMKEVH